MKFSSLAALEVVNVTTSSAASDENFIKISSKIHFSVTLSNLAQHLINPPMTGVEQNYIQFQMCYNGTMNSYHEFYNKNIEKL